MITTNTISVILLLIAVAWYFLMMFRSLRQLKIETRKNPLHGNFLPKKFYVLRVSVEKDRNMFLVESCFLFFRVKQWFYREDSLIELKAKDRCKILKKEGYKMVNVFIPDDQYKNVYYSFPI